MAVKKAVTASRATPAAKKATPSKKRAVTTGAASSAKRSAQAKKAVAAAKKPAAAKKAATAKKARPAGRTAPVAKGGPVARTPAPAKKKAAPAKKTATPAKKPAAAKKKAAAPAGKATPAKKAPAATRVPAAPAKKAAAAPKKAPTVGPYAKDVKFLEEQRALLLEERAIYQGQAEDLRAEADSLALEREPGDVQFDEESGEGGTVTVDRERDLALSAQALVAVEEIDDALRKIDRGTYGGCERCHEAIPKARLRALPYARLCVACKSGGLSRR